MIKKQADKLKSIRKAIPEAGVTIAIPSQVNEVIFKNEGENNILVMFNNTGLNYYTLEPKEKVQVHATEKTVFKAQGVGAEGTLAAIFW
jgi:hypothetical protein